MLEWYKPDPGVPVVVIEVGPGGQFSCTSRPKLNQSIKNAHQAKNKIRTHKLIFNRSGDLHEVCGRGPWLIHLRDRRRDPTFADLTRDQAQRREEIGVGDCETLRLSS